MRKRSILWGVLYGTVLLGFTLYVLLDTFVITRVYTTLVTPTQTTGTVPVTPTLTENAYEDGSISITLTEHRYLDTSVYVADVRLSSPEYLKTALAGNAYGRNVTQKTSQIAAANGAILAINGDFYGSRESGYVIRNGTLCRDIVKREQEDLVIYGDGTFAIVRESDTTAQQLVEEGAVQVFSFGPALVQNGTVTVTAGQEVGKAMVSNPRTAIAVIEPLHYLLVVSDGRTRESAGLTLLELAEFLQAQGAQTAYNLDGGGSATMVFGGRVVNNPTTNGRSIQERSVSDIVYIGH